MQLIDKDMLKDEMLNKWEEREISKEDLIRFTVILKKVPTVDAVPVVHGEWIKRGFDCSICKEWFVIDSKFIGRYKYCPNCGAKMDVTQSNDSNVLNALDGKEKDG